MLLLSCYQLTGVEAAVVSQWMQWRPAITHHTVLVVAVTWSNWPHHFNDSRHTQVRYLDSENFCYSDQSTVPIIVCGLHGSTVRQVAVYYRNIHTRIVFYCQNEVGLPGALCVSLSSILMPNCSPILRQAIIVGDNNQYHCGYKVHAFLLRGHAMVLSRFLGNIGIGLKNSGIVIGCYLSVVYLLVLCYASVSWQNNCKVAKVLNCQHGKISNEIRRAFPRSGTLTYVRVAYDFAKLLHVTYLHMTSHYVRTARGNHRYSWMCNKHAVYSHPLSSAIQQ